jgi:hypothetical protein
VPSLCFAEYFKSGNVVCDTKERLDEFLSHVRAKQLRRHYTLSEEKADPKIGEYKAGVSVWNFSKDDDSGTVGFSFGRVTLVSRMW